MTELRQQFKDFIAAQRLFTVEDTLLLAISGGVDSCVLLHLTIAAGYRVEIAHCNFGLRGPESDRDEAFVKALAAEYALPFHCRHFDTISYSERHKFSIQEAARELRYNWFDKMLEEGGCRYILTAHHADDNAETVLMNVFKGTGMAGLRGILPVADKKRRPLLFAGREELEAYAAEHGLAFVEDSSNLSDKYSRNFFRLKIIPLVDQLYPGSMDNLKQNLPRFREAEMLYREAVERRKKSLMKFAGGEWHIPVEKLRHSLPLRTLLFEIFIPLGFTTGQLAEIQKLMDSESGKYLTSATHRLLKNRSWFIITPVQGATPTLFSVEEEMNLLDFPGGQLEFSHMEMKDGFKPEADLQKAYIDHRELRFPLIIRKWKQGDYFYPLGMQKKKKLARFFIDQKLSLVQKEQVWVVESHKKILWVIGYRLDDRCKVRDDTRKMLRIHFKG